MSRVSKSNLFLYVTTSNTPYITNNIQNQKLDVQSHDHLNTKPVMQEHIESLDD